MVNALFSDLKFSQTIFTMGNQAILYTYMYIRTERIRIFVIISLILNGFSDGIAQIPHRRRQRDVSMHAVFFTRPRAKTARGYAENYST